MSQPALQPIPLGRSKFSALRSDNAVYVDKTEMLYNLCRTSSKVFLARPRRFGKSLLVSTFESLFKHGIRDFAGLAIEKLWSDTTYKVVSVGLLENDEGHELHPDSCPSLLEGIGISRRRPSRSKP